MNPHIGNRSPQRRQGERGARRGGDAERLGAVVNRVMRGLRPVRKRSRVAAMWESVAHDVVGRTKAVAVRRGVLIVEADTAALVHELQGFRREELLGRLVESGAAVEDLRFRLGVF